MSVSFVSLWFQIEALGAQYIFLLDYPWYGDIQWLFRNICWLACEEIVPKWKSDLAEKRRTEFCWEIKSKTYKGIFSTEELILAENKIPSQRLSTANEKLVFWWYPNYIHRGVRKPESDWHRTKSWDFTKPGALERWWGVGTRGTFIWKIAIK